MVLLLVLNPNIPYLVQLPKGLVHGSMIKISGEMFPTLSCDRFNVNLMTGPSTDDNERLDDVNLHVDVRPAEGAIVSNHLDERKFTMMILVENDQYKIYRAKFLSFNGDARIHLIEVIPNSSSQGNNSFGNPAFGTVPPYHFA